MAVRWPGAAAAEPKGKHMTDNTDERVLSYMRTYAMADAAFKSYDLPAEDILEGDPKAEVATHHQTPDGSVMVGVSRFSEGKYRYHQKADEINYVTRGRMIISSDQDDQVIECVAGTVTRLDKGVVYTKTIVEPYEEIWVMLGEGGVQM
jgi:uncharacterized cupin superfamily protein